MTHTEYIIGEKVKLWNIAASVVFVVLVGSGFLYLKERYFLPQEIPLFDFFILVFATLRLIRLFVYDNITLFIREVFLDVKRVRYAESGEETVERVPSQTAWKRTFDKLVNCPWCMGVWLAAFVVFGYFVFPELWIIFFLLAVAGVASALQILVNMFGWMAEEKKVSVQKLER